ncbi:hypothetical protein E7T06_18245 [Deinococcus sp. Arct2-2]|nr:hypothetical protein E7T06_18245 [Deinococcus sp. Arct2-2]
MVADFLENPSKYDLPPDFVTPEVRQGQRKVQAQQQRAQAEQEAHFKTEAEFVELNAAPPEVQWAAQRATLQLILKRRLNADQWAQLEALALRGEIQAAELTRVLVTATATSSLGQQVDQLRGQLRSLDSTPRHG